VTPEIGLTFAILVGAIVLFASERLPVDAIALLVVLALIVTGLLTPAEAFSGFANPAVIAVASIFILSGGLFQCGIAGRIGRLIVRLGGQSEPRLIAVLMIGTGLLSATMNDVAAVAVLLPAVVSIARQMEIAPSRLLLPLAYGAVMGGTLTLIGTPPNIIVSDVLRQRGEPPLGFFEITLVGAPLLLAGTAFMVTIGRRLLPDRPLRERLSRAELPEELLGIYHLPERIFALNIPAASPVVGRTLTDSAMRQNFDLTVLGVVRGAECVIAPEPSEVLRAGDRLLLEGGPRRVQRAARAWDLESDRVTGNEAELLLAGDTGLVEVTLAPRSRFEGQTLRELGFREKFGLTVLALWRGSEPIEREIADERLRMGDVLLVQGAWRRIRLLQSEPAVIVLLGDEVVPRRTRKASWAVVILLVMVALVVAEVAPISVAALGAALAIILTGCLRMEEAYRTIEWKAIFLVAGTLPLGMAMEKSGAVQWIADVALAPVADMGVLPLLAVLFLTTAALNLAMSNYATAVILAPIAFSIATTQGLDPRPLVLVVALASSVAYATPIAHQSNLLVMGPGDYRFSDYLRVGLPLSLVAFVVILLVVLVLW
jgi:di/tricarboxylate transporter